MQDLNGVAGTHHYIIPEYRYLITGNLCNIFNVTQDGLYITDRHGMTVALNSSYERLTGLKRENLLGKNIYDLVKNGTFDAVLNPEVVGSGNRITRVQVNSENRRVLLTGYPIFDYDNDVDLVVTTARDVTLMSQLEDQMAFQRTLIDCYQENIKGSREIFFESPEMLKLLEVIKRVARVESTVFLVGETGVGKDMVARKVHGLSPRSSKPFFKVDCANIPKQQLERDLFGYAPGAFFGANCEGKAGLFEIANGGTLFLDEVGDLPLAFQERLLHVLQDNELCRVGEEVSRKIDVRIIATTNRNLEQEVLENRFRSDLFYKLRVALVHIPALHQRHSEILSLGKYFLERYGRKYSKVLRFSLQAEEAMFCYSWPGNVRELEDVVRHLVMKCTGETIVLDDLPVDIQKSFAGRRKMSYGEEARLSTQEINWGAFFEGKSLKEITEHVERKALVLGMQKHESISSLAKTLKTERSTLSRKLKRYGIKVE